MQKIQKVMAGYSDVRCPLCGQGFLVDWTREQARNRHAHRRGVQGVLRAQHAGLYRTAGAETHPDVFDLAFELLQAAVLPFGAVQTA